MIKYEIITVSAYQESSAAVLAGTIRAYKWSEDNPKASIVSISHSVAKLDNGLWQAVFIVWYYEY